MAINLREIYLDLRNPEGDVHDDLDALRRSFALGAKLIDTTDDLAAFKKLVNDFRDMEKALFEARRRSRCKPKS